MKLIEVKEHVSLNPKETQNIHNLSLKYWSALLKLKLSKYVASNSKDNYQLLLIYQNLKYL